MGATHQERLPRPTLAGIGKQLGVSRQTIWNVIHHPEEVGEETRQRVLAAIRETGYRPSTAARALRTSRSLTIALRLSSMLDGINGALMDRFVHALSQAVQHHDYRLSLFSAHDADAETYHLDDLHRRLAIDACVLTDTGFNDTRPRRLRALGLPFAAFGRPWGDPEAAHPWVDIDGRDGTRQAAEYLRQLGHTEIGFLGWPVGSGVGGDGRRGWLEGCAPRAADAARLALAVTDEPRHGAQAAEELLNRGATAIVCASDSLAIGAAGVYSHRIAGGSALPITGFDDTPVAAALGLTSVAQPVEEAAEVVTTALLAILQGRDSDDPQQTLLKPRLVVRRLEPFVSRLAGAVPLPPRYQ